LAARSPLRMQCIRSSPSQVAQGELPQPDVVVAALGRRHGGRILADHRTWGFRRGVVGCAVGARRVVCAGAGRRSPAATLARTHPGKKSVSRGLRRALIVDGDELGDGIRISYASRPDGHRIAGQVGLELRWRTYTAKGVLGRAPPARLPRVACQAGHGFRGCSLVRFPGRPLRPSTGILCPLLRLLARRPGGTASRPSARAITSRLAAHYSPPGARARMASKTSHRSPSARSWGASSALRREIGAGYGGGLRGGEVAIGKRVAVKVFGGELITSA